MRKQSKKEKEVIDNFERANYFKNRNLLREKRKVGDKEFKINKKDRYIYHNELDKMKDMVEFGINDNGVETDKYKRFKDAYHSMSMACLSQQTLVLVTDSWESYYEGLFGYLAGNPNYTGMFIARKFPEFLGKVVIVGCNDDYQMESSRLFKLIEYWAKKVNL